MTGNLQNQLLDLIMEMHSLDSDYKLAKHLAVPLQSIRNYRLNKSKMDDTMCLQVAEALKMEPLQVMARVRLDGSENARTRRVWGSYLGRLFLVAVVAQAQPIDSFAQNDGQRTLTNIHYTHIDRCQPWLGKAHAVAVYLGYVAGISATAANPL